MQILRKVWLKNWFPTSLLIQQLFYIKHPIIASRLSNHHQVTYLFTYLLTYLLLTYLFTHSLTYSLTPWSRFLLEKLTSSELIKELPALYTTWRFIIAFTRACYLSQIILVNAPQSHCLKIHLNIILPSMPGSSKCYVLLRLSHQNPVCTSPLPHTCYIPCSSHSSQFIPCIIFGEEYIYIYIIKLLIM